MTTTEVQVKYVFHSLKIKLKKEGKKGKKYLLNCVLVQWCVPVNKIVTINQPQDLPVGGRSLFRLAAEAPPLFRFLKRIVLSNSILT